ncbi:hypothetical protein HNP99_002260 [Flavobacterium sp. 28A]|uniref:ABC-three component system protein n=1 Tax=Flavobacterium sp. 28A TaxID=2735895 RepID=UPI00156F5627|nr:ABC-three component system protein [Flavobacterium sp. 28A]NRT15900.1 hypothetical protein [Flavobacterium sp. 28A]
MTKEEKYLGRILLKNKFYEVDKQTYEDLFTKIMQNQDSNFKQIKPQGRLGDGKCDGFNTKTGEYYQVYAPEELTGNEAVLLSKMEASIIGLLSFWKEKGFEVKRFNYVVKDNYKNVYALTYTNAKLIAKKYQIECEVITCKDLEDIFMEFDLEEMESILGGMIPNPDNISNFEYDVMNEVVNHLKERKSRNILEKIPSNPNFDNKITFNSLSEVISEILNISQRQNYAINDFFQLNSKFIKEDLREIFTTLYEEGKELIPESETKNDEIFLYIVEKSIPNDKHNTQDAIFVLMAYYFEYCDIFETPTNN